MYPNYVLYLVHLGVLIACWESVPVPYACGVPDALVCRSTCTLTTVCAAPDELVPRKTYILLRTLACTLFMCCT